MRQYVLSPLAERDLIDIWNYVALDSPDAADRVLLKLRDELRKLAANPGLGHWRPDLPVSDLRVWTVYSYLIIFRFTADDLQVIRIIHGSRDLPNTL